MLFGLSKGVMYLTVVFLRAKMLKAENGNIIIE